MANGPTSESGLDLPASDDEAAARSEIWKSRDPFPEIRPALLNSADIADYAARTGLVYPFYADRLKSASYPIRLLGDFVYWDDEGQEVSQTLAEGAEFILRKNSIAFVTLEPMFRFPDYIAGRFNLKIPNVYKGLLLGTGPLVDPGWVGQLSFPLHNLTTNDYRFVGGEEIIWMEFTKVSDNDRWIDRTIVSPSREGTYVEYKGEGGGGNVRARVAAAAPNTPVSSSLSRALKRADDAAAAAEATETAARRFRLWYSIGGGIAIVVGLGTIVALAIQVLTYKQERQPLPPATDRAITSLRQRDAAFARRDAALSRRVHRVQLELKRVERRTKGG